MSDPTIHPEKSNEAVMKFLQDCIAQGFSWPIYVVFVGANGSMDYHRHDGLSDGYAPEILASYMKEGGFRFPIRVHFSDGQGKAAELVFRAKQNPQLRLVE